MKPVKQRIIKDAQTRGDCFRACMASMLEFPNSDELPHITSETWYFDWQKLLHNFGMSLNHDYKKIWREEFWIAGVPSLNFENTTHSIIMRDIFVEFDPSNLKQYEKGKTLLIKEVVKEAYWLEVHDVSKLKNINKYRKYLELGYEG